MTEVASQAAPESTALPPLMQPKIEAVYRSVGALLAKYRSGKLPKALKLVPVLSNWYTLYCICISSYAYGCVYVVGRTLCI